MTSLRPTPPAPLDRAAVVELGARSGLLWRSERTVLAGLGDVEEIELELSTGAATAPPRLGSDVVAFGAFPFSRDRPGTLFVPRHVVVADRDGTRIIGPDRAAADRLIEETLAEPPEPRPERIDIIPTMAADDWRDQIVAVARDRIRRGSLVKVVLARELVLRADRAFPVADTVRRLAGSFPEALVFCVDGFVGASPELLVARDGREVRALPLAGTAARSDEPEIDAARVETLLASTKDQLEHRITIEWLLEELLPFCSYVDAEPDPSVISMANVHHLATAVDGMLSNPPASILELVAAVHPTPALGGAPQALALDVIAELEGFDRGRYGGPVGWIDATGNGEFAVAVRSAQLAGVEAQVAAGVGVVAGSDPDAELAETEAKFRAALGALLG